MKHLFPMPVLLQQPPPVHLMFIFFIYPSTHSYLPHYPLYLCRPPLLNHSLLPLHLQWYPKLISTYLLLSPLLHPDHLLHPSPRLPTCPTAPLDDSTSCSSILSLIQNNHPIITIGKADIFKPNAFLVDLFNCEPTYVKAMEDEYATLMKNNTWELVTTPLHKKIVWVWVFKINKNFDGSISRYKARLVAQRFHQT